MTIAASATVVDDAGRVIFDRSVTVPVVDGAFSAVLPAPGRGFVRRRGTTSSRGRAGRRGTGGSPPPGANPAAVTDAQLTTAVQAVHVSPQEQRGPVPIAGAGPCCISEDPQAVANLGEAAFSWAGTCWLPLVWGHVCSGCSARHKGLHGLTIEPGIAASRAAAATPCRATRSDQQGSADIHARPAGETQQVRQAAIVAHFFGKPSAG